MAINAESGVTFRRDLSAVATEFAAEEARRWGFIGPQVAPVFSVPEAEGTYPVLCREQFLKADDVNRAEDGHYNVVDGHVGSQSFTCEDYGLESLLDDRKRRRYASFFDMEVGTQKLLIHKILLAQERRIAALAMDTTGTYSAVTVGTSWSNASATILSDVATGVDAIGGRTGMPPEMISLILTRSDFRYVCRNTEILAQVSSTYGLDSGIRPGYLQAAQIAHVLGIKQVLVGSGQYDTKGEAVTASLSAIWPSGYAQLAVLAEPGDPLESPSAWRTMRWTDDAPTDVVVERYRDDARRGDVLRVRQDTDEVATSEADLANYQLDLTA